MKRVKPFEIFRDQRGKYRWRVTAPNGKILAQSSESYTRLIDCREGAFKTGAILNSFLAPEPEEVTARANVHSGNK